MGFDSIIFLSLPFYLPCKCMNESSILPLINNPEHHPEIRRPFKSHMIVYN